MKVFLLQLPRDEIRFHRSVDTSAADILCISVESFQLIDRQRFEVDKDDKKLFSF